MRSRAQRAAEDAAGDRALRAVEEAAKAPPPRRDYPSFSGDTPRCPKCGEEHANTTYKQFGDCLNGEDHTTSIGWHENERLCRRCLRCGYAWDEATVDACDGDVR